ncbi:protein of unknown function [Paenibacillus alvei]|uniref:Uncharacterized protein n=1 Tax=Paenibacillus alvei TaxID=44250 RepID=A0A383R936_PAEAL|nr:protein of unknown function [Paenibacillus alvei]
MTSLSIPMIQKRKRQRSIAIMITIAVLIVIMVIISMNTGYIRLSPMDLLRTLFGSGTKKKS